METTHNAAGVVPLESAGARARGDGPFSGAWTVLGPIARDVRADLEGPGLDARGYANRVRWGVPGTLYLAPAGRAELRLADGLLPEELPQQLRIEAQASQPVAVDAVVAVRVAGSTPGQHEEKLVRLAGGTVHERRTVAFDLIDDAVNRPLTVPLRLAGLMLTALDPDTAFSWSMPRFASPIAVSAAWVAPAGEVDPRLTPEGCGKLRLRTLPQAGEPDARVNLLVRIEPFDADPSEPGGTEVMATYSVGLTPGESADLAIVLSPERTGVFIARVAAGMARPQGVLFASAAGLTGSPSPADFNTMRRDWARSLGAFDWADMPDAASAARGQPLDEYGRTHLITVADRDLAGRPHADALNLPPLEIVDRDLSDAAGWPDVYVAPGVVAFDPGTRRMKVHPPTDHALQFVGIGQSGFGVPGSGRILLSEGFAYVPAGEGDIQVLDVRDPTVPRLASIIETWCFYSAVFRFNDDLILSNNRGGAVLAVRSIRDPWQPGPLLRLGGARGRLQGVLPDGRHVLMSTDDGLQVMADTGTNGFQAVGAPLPGHGRLSGERLWRIVKKGVGPSETARLQAWRMRAPPEAQLDASVDLQRHEAAATFEYERIRDAGEDWVITGIGNRLTVREIQAAGLVTRCQVDVAASLDGPMVIRDVGLLDRRWLILLDGRQAQSQHSMRADSPRARLVVYDLDAAAARDDVVNYLEQMLDIAPGLERGVAVPAPDVERLPPLLTEAAAIYQDPDPSEYSNLTLDGHWAYINDYNYGLRVFDLSDPRRPLPVSRHVGCGEGRIGGYVGGGLAFVGQTFGGSILAFDISEPTRPRPVGHFWDGAWCRYWSRFAGVGRVLYAARRHAVKIIDFADPAHPLERGVFRDADGDPVADGNPLVWDQTACVAAPVPPRGGTEGSVRYWFYDLADPVDPQRIGELDLDGPPGQIVQMTRAGDLLVSVDNQRLRVIHIGNPAEPELLGEVTIETMRTIDPRARLDVYQGHAEGVAVVGDVAYTTYSDPDGIRAAFLQFDLSDPENPRFVGLVKPPGMPAPVGWAHFYGDLIAYGPYLVAGNYGQIELYDATDPARLRTKTFARRGYQWSSGTVHQGTLYVPSLSGLTVYRLPVPDLLGGGTPVLKVFDR